MAITYGLGVAAIITRIGEALIQGTLSGDSLTKAEQAITAAGTAACLWQGRPWPWLRTYNTFPTVDGTALYALRTVNAAVMANLWRPLFVFLGDDYRLVKRPPEEYHRWRLENATVESMPENYAIEGDINMYLWPTPDTVYTVTVNYIKRHGNITSASTDTELIVPAEFHYPVYVDGAIWLLRHAAHDPGSLEQCPAFKTAMDRMAATEVYDSSDRDNLYADSYGERPWPAVIVNGVLRS